jgi:polar amino acid transport system ATP-binding protein
VTCVVGPSGSGKSTLLRAINLLESIDSGAIFHDGRMIGHTVVGEHRVRVRGREARSQVLRFGMVFQSFNLFSNMTAIENVMLAPRRVRSHSRTRARALARRCLDEVGLADKYASYPSQLSGGQQQRVAIARTLAMEPDILLFDEPTSALDPELVGEVLAVMRGIAETGRTMIIVTHEMSFAREVADRLVMMADGEIIEDGRPDEILFRPATARARQFFRTHAAAEPGAG